VENTIFAEKTFVDCLLVLSMDAMSPKNLKIYESLWKFSPSKVFRYTVCLGMYEQLQCYAAHSYFFSSTLKCWLSSHKVYV